MRRCAGAPARRSWPTCWRELRSRRRTRPARPAEMTRSGRFEWPIVIVLLVIAAISRSPALIVLGAGGLVVWLVVWVTGRLALVGLETQLAIAPDRLIAGELLVAAVTIIN